MTKKSSFFFRKNRINSNHILCIILYFTDTSTNEYFKGKNGLKLPVDRKDFVDRSSKPFNTQQLNTQQRKGSLAKLDSVDVVDCKLVH